jgi:hypothetical protein
MNGNLPTLRFLGRVEYPWARMAAFSTSVSNVEEEKN